MSTRSRSDEFAKGHLGGHVYCDNCGEKHPAEYSHEGQHKDGLTDYYTSLRLEH